MRKPNADGKGVVIFTLDSGSTVRDTSKEIFFSGPSSKAERAALLYAVKKWGKRLAGKELYHVSAGTGGGAASAGTAPAQTEAIKIMPLLCPVCRQKGIHRQS